MFVAYGLAFAFGEHHLIAHIGPLIVRLLVIGYIRVHQQKADTRLIGQSLGGAAAGTILAAHL